MRKIANRLGVGLAVSTTTVLLGITTTPTAHAEEASATQAAAVEGRFWIYDGTGYTGYRKSYNTNDRWFANDEWDGTSITVDNDTSSAQNLTNRTATLYQVGNSGTGSCWGYGARFAPGDRDSDMIVAGYDLNNQASCIIFS